jgi:hypothetical protein
VFRGDVILVGLLLAVPVLFMGAQGSLTFEETGIRVLLCLVASAVGLGVLRAAAKPLPPLPDFADGPDEAAAPRS